MLFETLEHRTLYSGTPAAFGDAPPAWLNIPAAVVATSPRGIDLNGLDVRAQAAADAPTWQVQAPATTGRIVQAADFGVSPTNVDNRAALQAAFNHLQAGSTLVIAPGVYQVSAFVVISGKQDFVIDGAGATLVSNGPVRTSLGDMVRINDSTRFVLRGLTLDGNSGQRGQYEAAVSLRLGGASDFRIENMRFLNATTDHLYIGRSLQDKSLRGEVVNSVFENAYRNGISVINGEHIRIAGNRITGVWGTRPGAGIDIESNPGDPQGDNRDIVVESNLIQDTAGFGVRITHGQAPREITVLRNTLLNTTGIRISGQHVRVAGNLIDGVQPGPLERSPRGAIYATSLDGINTVIEYNDILNVREGMIGIDVHITFGGQMTIRGNRIADVASNAINVHLPQTVIEENIVLRPGLLGIAVGGTGSIVRNNTVVGSGSAAIYATSGGHQIVGNDLRGASLAIHTLGGLGGSSIAGNLLANGSLSELTRLHTLDNLLA